VNLSRILIGSAGSAIILVFGLFLFAIQDNIIKYFSDEHSVLQIVFIRGLIAAALMIYFIKTVKESIPIMSRKPMLIFWRGALGFASYTCYYLAVAAMPLAEVVAITFTMPLFVTVMSALILGEKVGLRRWSAVVIGFIGVLVILSPTGEFNPLAVVFAFIAAVTYASQTIITRFLSSYDHPMTIAFNAILVFTLLSGGLSLMMFLGVFSVDSSHPSLAFFGRDWITPSLFDASLMIAIGFIAAIGFYCLSHAYCTSEASAIAPFEFTYLVWAVVFGYLIWGEVPGPTTLGGVIILVGSSLYIWYRERQLDLIASADPPGIDSAAVISMTPKPEFPDYQR
jgi:drug/metabolite transporter (DMT)-like permease